MNSDVVMASHPLNILYSLNLLYFSFKYVSLYFSISFDVFSVSFLLKTISFLRARTLYS